jgi:tRNA nucleotidyltransferase (CCA-adding enzyme)
VQDLLAALDSAIPPEVRTISRVLQDAGFKSWIVGGCVRDIARGLEKKSNATQAGDWDLATNAPPQKVVTLFKRVIPTGLEHGTVTIVLGKQHFEVTTLRGERGHSDGRHPDEVFFVDDLDEDLLRRDMTVNAMAYNIAERTFHDPFFGLADLGARLLRAVGDPAARFSEDGLRVLRCARFCATLGFSIEEKTAKAIEPSLDSFRRVAQERVRDEWFKAFKCREASRFLRVLLEHGLLAVTFPELFQKSRATSPDFEAALERIDAAPTDPIFRLALFCVLGAVDSENVAQDCALRLKLSREESTRLKLLAKHHSPPSSLSDSPTLAKARRYLSEIGREQALDVMAFQGALQPSPSPEQSRAHSLMTEALNSGDALSLKELNIDGKDLMAAGIPRGPELGQTLKTLLEAALDDPQLNTREKLLALATSRC